ncbi:mucin-1 [Lacerta agilis]|uniref:mucin-1 n=1 Tax=Lacerta agilis TaxID=80427 RepID=UPI00141A0C79|nr:mucin-1 [Lacerta agilis]
MISHVTEISTASTEGSRESSTSSGENENSTATSPPGSLVTKEETPTPSPPTTSTSPKPTTPKPPAVQTFTITYHIEKTFTEKLSDKSSAAYKELEDKIGKMYQEVYNCSTCPNAGQYVGFMVNSFSKGSVVANTKVHFTESAKVSSEELRTALSDASEDKRQGLNLTQIEGKGLKDEQWGVTSDTTEPSTSPPSTTTSTTLPSLMYFLLSYHIEMVFSEDFLNPSSSGYEKLNGKIGKMYEEVYNCLGCPTAGRYYGYTVNSFRPGSVVADTTLWFVGGTSISSEELRNALSRASPEKRQYLNLANIEARNFGSDTPSHPETVPGWGIALLVLVCILLLLALIAFLIQIIHWCRRNHRGKLDLLSNQDSYHIMSEYPTYHTHGRYVAPGSKPNPYSETLPKNGNAPFSYTNPTMANDEL